jgi:hypothetical protein
MFPRDKRVVSSHASFGALDNLTTDLLRIIVLAICQTIDSYNKKIIRTRYGYSSYQERCYHRRTLLPYSLFLLPDHE